MLDIIKANDRGKTELDWLDSRHTFSFGSYYNSRRMGFSALRVLNDDVVGPSAGFPKHSHQNMEIVSFVLKGALKHKDSMGNSSIINAGDVQRMSAGKGVTHSEFNASDDSSVRFLQVWIETDKHNITPEYEQDVFSNKLQSGEFTLVVSPSGEDGALTIHQDVSMQIARLDGVENIEYSLPSDRCAWVQVIKGNLSCNNAHMSEGDGAAVYDVTLLTFDDANDAEFLLIDLPKE